MNKTGYPMPSGICIVFLAMVLLSSSWTFAADRKLALFPLTIYSEHPENYVRQGLRTMLVSRLAGAGLDVLTDQDFGSLLTDREREGMITRQRVEEVAKKVGADYAVFGSVTNIGTGYSLDLSFLDLTKGRPKLTRVSEAMTQDQFIPMLADVANRFRAMIEGRYVSPKRRVAASAAAPPGEQIPTGLFSRLGRPRVSGTGGEGEGLFRATRQLPGFQPAGSLPLDHTVVSFDAGDMAGDGNLELAVLARRELRIYARGADGTYRLRDTLTPDIGESFLKVSVGDANGDGKAEIYLVSVYGVRARTSVYGWNGKLKLLYRREGHLRVVKDPKGKKTWLLYRDSVVGAFYSGDTFLMGYDKAGKLIKIKALPTMKDARFYTLTPYDPNRYGKPEYIGLGQGNTLQVWGSDGSVLWSEDQEIGGTNNAISVGQGSPGEAPPRIPFNSRLVIADIEGNGKEDLVAVRNIPLIGHLMHFKVYMKSQLIAYRMDGATLTRGWDTREIPYCIADIQVVGKTLFLAAQKGKITKIFSGNSKIFWFDLK